MIVNTFVVLEAVKSLAEINPKEAWWAYLKKVWKEKRATIYTCIFSSSNLPSASAVVEVEAGV